MYLVNTHARLEARFSLALMMKAIIPFILIISHAWSTWGQSKTIDSLKAIVDNVDLPDTTHILAKAEWAFDLWAYDLDSLKLLADQALEASQQINYPKGIALSKRALGNFFDEKGAKQQSIATYLEAIEILETLDEAKYLAATYDNIGYVYDDIGQYERALDFYFKGLEINEALGDSTSVAMLHNNIGTTYQNQGNYKGALKYYFESLAIWRALDRKAAQSYVFTNIGIIYRSQGRYEKALQYHFKALEIDESFNDTYGVSLNLDNIGSIYTDMGDYGMAKEYLTRSVQLADQLESDRRAAYASIGLARVFAQLNEPAKGIESARKALNHALVAGVLQVEASSHVVLGACYRRSGAFAEAIAYGEKSLTFANDIPLQDYRDALDQLYQSYEASGSYKQALVIHKLFKTIQDSIINEKNTQELTRLEAEYEFQKEMDSVKSLQEQERILQAAKAKQKVRQQTLLFFLLMLPILAAAVIYILRNRSLQKKKMLALRNRISQDLHDEIGSTLSSIALYGTVASSTLEREPKKSLELLELINSHASRTIESMNDIVWAINSTEDSVFNLVRRIQSNASDIEGSGKWKIMIESDQALDQVSLNMMQRRNTYAIVKECLAISTKYWEGGRIDIQLSFVDNRICLHIATEATQPLENGQTSLIEEAFNNVHQKALEIGGELKISCITENGVVVLFKFKLSQSLNEKTLNKLRR